ncbi:hypothetical protein Dsin_000119 [Dipteronia sinensis]|uniref:Uncharacterized protein n=1 Tax=Dipteronia sinensis TaxID=43782 RepID=A0AAD9ZJ99_9ROSI|nr:hypothetical protein Dsin_000119 [Dipteronia sinensis]
MNDESDNQMDNSKIWQCQLRTKWQDLQKQNSQLAQRYRNSWKRNNSISEVSIFRHEEPQPQLSMDSVEVYDAKFPVSRTLSDLSVGKDDAAKDEDEDEGRRKRLSSGRPLRQAVAKLKSYKEMPLNFKMWRSE